MIDAYVLERWDGTNVSVSGEDGWELLLSHEDVVEPGRIHTFAVINAGHKVAVELGPDDLFRFARRTRMLGQPSGEWDLIGTRTVFGREQADGLGYFYVIYPNGGVTVTPEFSKG